MRHRWYYLKYWFRINRPLLAAFAGILFCFLILMERWDQIKDLFFDVYNIYGGVAAEKIWEFWCPGNLNFERKNWMKDSELYEYIKELETSETTFEDPAYERILAEESKKRKERENERIEDIKLQMEEKEKKGAGIKYETQEIAVHSLSSDIWKEKLADYDYVMKNFYSVHPTTTAGRDLIDAEKFLSMDFSIQQSMDQPQILIYHTHSQESFSDYEENPDATVVSVGNYLEELLEERGYQVIHDTSVYDYKDGKLDRSQAYTYALDGITGILQKYPSIEVVLDIHRDGVSEGTRLVTEIDGKPTAKIMFFNGTSQTPDGPIEYLPNPNREANLAFSFQMQLKAREQYPEFTRNIYLKGLRYNEHVRARTSLIEVGAQTNTYAEALNAMEPLAEILCQVLSGN